MNKKFFVIDESVKSLSKNEVALIEKNKNEVFSSEAKIKSSLTRDRFINEQINLKHVEGRIIIKIDIDYKNSHTFQDGTKIYRGRQFNNLNRRDTEPVNAWVVDSEYIPKGAEILIHPNAISDTNKIEGYGSVGLEGGNSIRYYSIEEISAFLWRENSEKWKPLKGFAIALRVFEPYKGALSGIEPKQIDNVLYIQTGEYKGKVSHTVKASDYEIIFQNEHGREERLIRCRHYENEYRDREELIAIDYSLTNKVNNGELLIGLSPTDWKTLNTLQDA